MRDEAGLPNRQHCSEKGGCQEPGGGARADSESGGTCRASRVAHLTAFVGLFVSRAATPAPPEGLRGDSCDKNSLFL